MLNPKIGNNKMVVVNINSKRVWDGNNPIKVWDLEKAAYSEYKGVISFHNENGPSLVRSKGYNGSNRWYLNNIEYTREKYFEELKKMGKSDVDIFEIALKYPQ